MTRSSRPCPRTRGWTVVSHVMPVVLAVGAAPGGAQIVIDSPGAAPWVWLSGYHTPPGDCWAYGTNPESGGVEDGGYFQARRTCGGGDTAFVLWVDIHPNTIVYLQAYMRRANTVQDHWCEFAYKVGHHTAQDYIEDASSWTVVNRFDNDTPGNGNVWLPYDDAFLTGPYDIEVSLGFRYGSLGVASEWCGWDQVLVDDPAAVEDWALYCP